MGHTLFVGDVHGCAAELEELLERTGYDPAADRLLLTGDAFSRGPDPLHVWEILRDTGAAMVLGNHDDRLLRQLRDHRAGRPVDFRRPEQRRCFEQLRPALDELLPWLESVPLAVDEPAFLLVHAGIHPEGGLAGTSRDEFLRIRTWPPTGGIEGLRWHDAVAPLDGRVLVFGHDAPGGLVVKRRSGDRAPGTPGAHDPGSSNPTTRDSGACGPRAGQPWLVGLDSGCVYGGRLSAWLLEADRIVQVPSRAA